MRVTEIEFDMNVAVGPSGTGANPTRWVRAPAHDMHWLPEEQVLVIDGWRYSPRGARWKVEDEQLRPELAAALPTDDTSMFRVLAHTVDCGGYPCPIIPGCQKSAPAAAPEVTDGPDQPGGAGRKARGKKRRPV